MIHRIKAYLAKRLRDPMTMQPLSTRPIRKLSLMWSVYRPQKPARQLSRYIVQLP
jgi:hypothetical protein